MSFIRERALTAILSAVGLGLSLYLSAVHFSQGQIPLAHASGGLVECERVTTGPASAIGPVPVAVLGVVWFLVALILSISLLPLNRSSAARAVILWSVAGVAGVFYLVYVELVVVDAICLWCTVAHILIIAIFLLAVHGSEVAAADRQRRSD
jgi:uncharacterized membrane protein